MLASHREGMRLPGGGIRHWVLDRASRLRWLIFLSFLFLHVGSLYGVFEFGSVSAWGADECQAPVPLAKTPLGVSSATLDEIRQIDPETARRQYADQHFQKAEPLILEKSADGTAPTSGVPLHIMAMNFEHLNPNMHSPEDWHQKIVSFGKTVHVEHPDVIAGNEVYLNGLDIFRAEVLKPLGYEAIIDEKGGKDMPQETGGGRMSVGFIYNPQKVRVISEESIPLDIPAAVPHTRNIYRITLELTIGGPEFVVYVVHFKSAMFLKEPISLPGGGVIKTSNQLRRRQFELLQSRMEQDVAAGMHVFALGDFNTPFRWEGFVNPDNPSERPFGVGKKERWMVWSAQPFRRYIAQASGADVLDEVDGYSHRYSPHGSKLDHIVFVSGRSSTPLPFRFLRAEQRRYIRYPWHVDAKGYPDKGEVSDHFPLSAHFFLAHPSTSPTR